jgi:hypothetical protein
MKSTVPTKHTATLIKINNQSQYRLHSDFY